MSAALPMRTDDPLVTWIDRRSAKSAGPVPDSATVAGGLRFAFYGRVSTKEFQDRTSSCYWQREVADDLIAGRGSIVAEFFDVGLSRRRGWESRPQAARETGGCASKSQPKRRRLQREQPSWGNDMSETE